MALNPFRSFGKRAAAVATAAVVGASAFAFPATAAPLPKDECRLADLVIQELFKKHDGKLSQVFVDSMKTFSARDCDMDVDFKMTEGTQDKAAFGELRTRLVAYRMTQASRTNAPVRQ